MILGNSPYLQEEEDVNPFLTNTAFAAETIGGITGWHFGRKSKKYHDLGRTNKLAAKALNPDTRFLTQVEKFKTGRQRWSNLKEIRSFEKKAASYSSKRLAARTTAKAFRTASGLLGLGSVFAIGMELGKGMFDLGTSYHSAQRSRRFANADSSNESMYYDTRVAATMRQRALQVIHNSQLSTRAAFGQEASYMHN